MAILIDSTPAQVDNICYVYPDTPIDFSITSSITEGALYHWYLNDILVSIGTGYTLSTPNLNDVVYAKEIILTEECNSYRVVDNTSVPSEDNVGTLRYRKISENSSVCEMIMQTGASTFEWVEIKTNTW